MVYDVVSCHRPDHNPKPSVSVERNIVMRCGSNDLAIYRLETNARSKEEHRAVFNY